MNKHDGITIRKTKDAIQLNLAFGYRKDTLSKWYYSVQFSFNTQFTNGYASPNTDQVILKPFTPTYIFIGIGVENINIHKNRILYVSPFTFKTTLVLDNKFANQDAFGVAKLSMI